MNFWEKPDLLVLSGSHLYGYATEQSDEDLLGFVVPPLRVELSMINRFEQKTPSKEELEAGNDTKIYSLKKFISQLSRNDTQCLEILYAPKTHVKVCTWVGEWVIDNRNLFLSKQFYNRFAGYAYSEFRKVRGVALLPTKQTPNEQQVIDQIRNLFRPEKKEMDQIIEFLYTNQPKEEVSIFRKLGKARKESIEKFGYSVKNVAHCVRLLIEGIEILTTGNLQYPLKEENVQLLKDIRAGNLKFEEVEEKFHAYEKELKKAAENSHLPEKVDMNKIDNLFLDITERLAFNPE